MSARNRLLFTTLGLLLFADSSARADIAWFDTSTNRVYYDDGVTALFGYKGSNDISCFVQLIDAGTNGTIDAAINAGAGVSADDAVVAWSYIGENVPGAAGSTSAYGRVVGSAFTNETAGDLYYVRVWTAPSPDFSSGLVPTDATNYYGNSVLFTAHTGFDPPNPPENFNFGAVDGFATTLQAVPEPGTLTLSLAVAVCAWIRKRRTAL